MKVTVLIEGRTEKAFKPHLVAFLKERVSQMTKLDFFICDGRVYTGEKLRRAVHDLLTKGKHPSGAVVALADVYTGTNDCFAETDFICEEDSAIERASDGEERRVYLVRVQIDAGVRERERLRLATVPEGARSVRAAAQYFECNGVLTRAGAVNG